MTTLLIKKGTKKDISLLIEIAKKIGIDVEQIQNNDTTTAEKSLSLKERQYLKNLKKVAVEMKEISSGSKKGQTLQSFLDEL